MRILFNLIPTCRYEFGEHSFFRQRKVQEGMGAGGEDLVGSTICWVLYDFFRRFFNDFRVKRKHFAAVEGQNHC
jgi:hypothetical protein